MISNRARAYMRTRATEQMSYRCMGYRTTKGEYDEETLVYTLGGGVALFDEEQPCRVWEISGATAVTLGETEIMTQNIQISLPWDSLVLKKNDEIEITQVPVSDETLMGKRFEVVSSARAGELRPTRRYTVKAVER